MSAFDWWDVERAFARGLLTLAEAHDRATLILLEHVAELREDERRGREFRTLRGTVQLPTPIGELELLIAVQEAIVESDAYWRAMGWWTPEHEEHPPAATLGLTTCDYIAVALAGLPRSELWKLAGTRRVVRPLQGLVRSGLVCRGVSASGQAYGYEMTPDGVLMLVQAEAIDSMEVVEDGVAGER